ncbi:hypothetical protein CC117_30220 [Parafrankia colletiae]|uniref:Band 7 domain-containing protein n=1 Tax=Parafrankia colletiae TaxID=573497 RepID=A0A1S1Q688_9ACTN|nr:hypothetical protein [Parafrankia colletiae]MCK9904172.1 hypothetical protein [Frankia sp. Cpl3]OHV28632.1 hypothetical protein CC117_30220 [Parafrankia colletiae]
MKLTYNPLIEHREVPSIRWLKPIASPQDGTVLLLASAKGSVLAVQAGEPVPAAWLGTHRWLSVIDVRDHRVMFELALPSRDPAFAFRGRVSLVCYVKDPRAVLARGIDDVAAAVREYLRWMLTDVAGDFDITQFHQARRALNERLRHFAGDSAIGFREGHVELLLDEDEIEQSGRAIRDLQRKTRLAEMERNATLRALDERGAEALIAEIFQTEGARAALAYIDSAEAAEREMLARAWETILTRTDDKLEPFELAEAEAEVRRRLLSGSSAPFGGTRSRRLRGTARELTGAPEPGSSRGWDVDGSRPGSAAEAASDGGRTASTSTRTAPTSARADGPSEDPPWRDPVRRDSRGHATDGPPEDEPLPEGPGDARPAGAPRASRLRGTARPGH